MCEHVLFDHISGEQIIRGLLGSLGIFDVYIEDADCAGDIPVGCRVSFRSIDDLSDYSNILLGQRVAGIPATRLNMLG